MSHIDSGLMKGSLTREQPKLSFFVFSVFRVFVMDKLWGVHVVGETVTC